MRVMVLVKANEDSENGVMPTTAELEAMGAFNEELVKAGVMLAGDGLKPTSAGKRVRFEGTDRTVLDGPFAETKELVAGYWLWEVGSVDEAVEWLKKAPFDGGNEVEIRPFYGPEDFGDNLTPELLERENQLRQQAGQGEHLSTATAQTVEAVWRIESARLTGALLRVTRDLGRAEDLAQDALVAALEQWPGSGVPANPGAWLMAVARRRYIDGVRREVTYERKLDEVGRAAETEVDPMAELEFDRHVSDDVLRLMFAACHPVLTAEARVALTLRTVAGLSTEEIARAFVVPTPTMAARITRAKKALAAAGVPFEVPVGDELDVRLPSVLEAVYLIFNEGYTATSGSSWARPALCAEAMRLGRMLAALAPSAEPLGLVALMEIQASRLRARVSPTGEPVTLLEQNRGQWDRLLITHALDCLDRAVAMAPHGSYVLQASLAACHARAAVAEDTDWLEIARLYSVLVEQTGSPVVELNRAVAVSMADGPAAGLAVADGLLDVAALRDYHLLPSVRGDLLAKLGRTDEARAEFERAASLTSNDSERELLLRRAADCG